MKEILLNKNIPIGHNLSKQQLLNKLLVNDQTPTRQSYHQNYYKEITKPNTPTIHNMQNTRILTVNKDMSCDKKNISTNLI